MNVPAGPFFSFEGCLAKLSEGIRAWNVRKGEKFVAVADVRHPLFKTGELSFVRSCVIESWLPDLENKSVLRTHNLKLSFDHEGRPVRIVLSLPGGLRTSLPRVEAFEVDGDDKSGALKEFLRAHERGELHSVGKDLLAFRQALLNSAKVVERHPYNAIKGILSSAISRLFQVYEPIMKKSD